MRLIFGMCCLLFLTKQSEVFAQNQDYLCGWKDELQQVSNVNSSPCFDVEDVFKNCKTVYVRINLHFFVGDDCNGSIQQLGKSQREVFKISEEMIDFANNTFANNEVQRKSPDAVAPCVPIRLVLKGIYLHCKSDVVGITNTPTLNLEYGVNTTAEINFYIAKTEIGATGIGFHEQRCGSATAFNKDTWWSIGNLVHEVGHILTLNHSFEFDGCNDTPKITYDWDKNCNGILENSNDREMDETNLTCWNKLESNRKPGEEGYSDINLNNVNDCDEQFPCSVCPCCNIENVDNNIMSYSAIKSAITSCQIKKMLNDLSGYNCGLIEKIGDCPPASAFITQTPEDKIDQTRCRECLILEASVNEEQYELKLFERINGQEILVYNSGWKTGKASNFCYRTGAAFKGMFNYLKPNTEYVAYLKAKNSCSEDQYKYLFFTNSGDCGAVSYESISISPNPVLNGIIVEFTANQVESNVQVFAKNMFSGSLYMISQNQTIVEGANRLYISEVDLPQGTYTLMIEGEHSIYQNNFVKM